MRSFQRKFRKLQRSVVTSLVLLLCLGTAQANWWDFIDDTYGDSDIDINYYDDFNDFMGNASDNAVDSYFDALSGIDYEDSNDSDYAWNGYIPTATTYGSSGSSDTDSSQNDNSANDGFDTEEEDDDCNDPCLCYGDCDEEISNGTTNNPPDEEKPTDKPEEKDCDEADIKNAQNASNKLDDLLKLPTLNQLDARITESLQTLDGTGEQLLRKPYLPTSNQVMTNMNLYASNRFVEAGYTFESRPSGSFVSNLITGSAYSITLPMTAGTTAIIHSHPMQISGQPSAGPSPQDFVGLLQGRFQNGCNALNESYVVAHGGATYVLSITDPEAAQSFYSQNKTNLGTENGMFKEGTAFFKEYFAMQQYLKDIGFSAADAHDAAMAYVLDKNKTGVTLMKKEKGDDEFKTMKTKGTMNSDEKVTDATSTKCK